MLGVGNGGARAGRRNGVFIDGFGHGWHLVLVFLLLTLDK